VRGVASAARYFAFVELAGGLCDMSSLVGLRGFLMGMLSGFVALAAPEAAAGGGITIGVPPACGATVWPHATCATPAADAASKTALPSDAQARRLIFVGIIAISVLGFSGLSLGACQPLVTFLPAQPFRGRFTRRAFPARP
jgi:hypothetical protein